MSEVQGAGWQRRADGSYALSGALVLGNVAALRARLLAELAGAGASLRIDLSAVRPVDSGGLALLIDLLAWSRAAGRELQFAAPTEAILALARISDVESLLAA